MALFFEVAASFVTLTPVAALALGVVMILAAALHLRRGERGQAARNGVILLLCLPVAYGRFCP